jgi:2-oxoglutarate dehydrogenase E1 component
MTPKSLLRHPRATSSLEDCATGGFRRILPDTVERADGAAVTRVLLCSGKVYYDIEEERRTRERDDVAIVRVEQLYPLDEEDLARALAPYPAETPLFWVQEEPENMGAWRYLHARFGDRLDGRSFARVSRPASASPATGSAASHKLEQRELLNEAFGDVD